LLYTAWKKKWHGKHGCEKGGRGRLRGVKKSEILILGSFSDLNLISAVQDEPSTTPPTSRKGSAVSQTSAKTTTPPPTRKDSEGSKGSPNVPKSQTLEGKKQQQQNKPQDTQKPTTKESSSAQATKIDQSPKLLPKACPLCKAGLRRDPPNYSTCTECKATVCNQCGFNPVPHQTEVRNRLMYFLAVGSHYGLCNELWAGNVKSNFRGHVLGDSSDSVVKDGCIF